MMKNNMEDNSHTKYTRGMLLILAGILLLASIIGYVVSQNLQVNKGGVATQNKSAPSIAPTLIPYPKNGSFVLKLRPGTQNIQTGKSFILDLYATSGKDTVAGYDVIFSYDQTAFSRQSVQNGLDSFRIFTFNRKGHLAISATKNISSVEPVRLDNTPLLSFTFIALKKGMYVFSLKPVGNESSKLVNERAQVTYPEVSDFRLEIK